MSEGVPAFFAYFASPKSGKRMREGRGKRLMRKNADANTEEKLVPRDGIEPPTRGFSIPCSTD